MSQPSEPVVSPRQARPWLWRLSAAVAALLLAVTLLMAALWVWAGSEGSLATALGWWKEPALQTRQVTGSLRHGGQAAQLHWRDEQGHDIQAEAVTLRWNWRALLERRLHVHQLQASTLRVDWPSSEQPSAGPPESLALPFQVQVDALQIDSLQWAGPPALQASGLRARYDFNGQQHALTLAQADVAQGRYSGQAELQARSPLALSAQLQGQLSTPVPGSTKTWPLQLALQANGPLSNLQLQGQLKTGAGMTGQTTAVAPSAQIKARLTPWGEQPVPEASAVFAQLNLALLWPQAPQTLLTGQAEVRPDGTGWLINGQLQNALPGPWNQQRLPVQRADWRAEWRGGQVLVQSLNAQVGAGRLQAQGQWLGAGGQDWQVLTRFEQLNPNTLHSQWPAQSLQGQAQLQGSSKGLADGLGFDVLLQAPTGGDPRLDALQLLDAQARGRWRIGAGGNLDLHALSVRTRQAQLSASGQYQVKAQALQGQLRLQAPGFQIQGDGQWQPDRGNGQAKLQSQDLPAAWRWLSSLPGMAEHLPPAPTAGRGDVTLAWQGGWRDPALQATLDIPTLNLAASGNADKPADAVQVSALQARLDGRLSQARLSASGQMVQGKRRAQFATAGEGGAAWTSQPGKPSAWTWQASVQQLNASLQDPALGAGAWQLVTQRPFNLKGATSSSPGTAAWLELQPGQAQLGAPARPGSANTPAVLDWQASRWQAGQLRTSGTLKGLPLAWAELLAGPQLARAGVAGDLLFDGRWDVSWGQRLKLDVELVRRSGDLSIHAETSAGLATRVAAGVREARLSLQGDANQLQATLRWDSERAGKVQGTLQAKPKLATGTAPPMPWNWSGDTALSGELQAQLPRIGAWSLLAPPGWRLRGSLATALRVSGTMADPQLSGQLQADDLALRSVVDGVELGNGRLRGQLDGNRLLIDEFSLQGAGPGNSGGRITATGEAAWTNGQPQVRLKADLQQLRASVRSDRQLTVSGDLQAALRGREGEITGVLRVDQARLELPSQERPQLDSDVVVRGSPQAALPDMSASPASAPSAGTEKPKIRVAVRVDLGDDFRLQGKGVSTRVRGALAITDESLGTPRLFGTVTTVDGEYRAYGQRLNIERGVLRFTGPLDNPSLDILAIRPNLTQRVGVQVTGTALLPRVTLYAEPELPEAEKLSWLVLGHSSASGGAEAALLQQAAIALLGNARGGGSRNLASTLGLDELSFRTPSTQADGTASAGAVTFGKRFSRNFYAAYERSLSGTLGTLYMFYELSQRFTVRAQAGEQTAVDLIFTVPYE